MIDESTLNGHLKKLGWECTPHGEDTLRSVRKTLAGDLSIYLRLTEDWFVASVVPFLSTKGDNSFELSRWLLRMNRDMHQAKFAYDDDGDVVLTVELPTESLDFSEIQSALKTLEEQAVTHRQTLRNASKDPS